MANISIPNLCGSNQAFSDIQSQIEKITGELVSGLESEASSLASTLTAEANFLESKLRALVPQAPELPNVNLQAEITSLVSIDRGTAAGNDKYLAALALITTKFGSALTASGFSLDTLVTNSLATIAGGNNLCDLVPNFEVPADGSGEAFEKAKESLQPTIDAVKEEVSKLNKNTNLTEAKSSAETLLKKFTSDDPTTLPTENTGAYVVGEKSTKVSRAGGAKTEVTTASDAGEATTRPNVSPNGFSNRPTIFKQMFTYPDVKYVDSKFLPYKQLGRASVSRGTPIETSTSTTGSGFTVIKLNVGLKPFDIKKVLAYKVDATGAPDTVFLPTQVNPIPGAHTVEIGYKGALYKSGLFSDDIPDNVIELSGTSQKGTENFLSYYGPDKFAFFEVIFSTHDTFDPNYTNTFL